MRSYDLKLDRFLDLTPVENQPVDRIYNLCTKYENNQINAFFECVISHAMTR